ncbi:MAG: hypothetical protein ACYS22_16405, partial [Planctomycetota bacterium]
MEVSVALNPKVVFDDAKARVEVDLKEVDRRITGLELTASPALRVEGPVRGGRHMTLTNGRRRTDTVRFHFVLTPREQGTEGTFSVGPLKVVFEDGSSTEYAVEALRVARRAPRGAKLEVRAAPAGGPVAMPFVVRMKLLYSGELHQRPDAFGRAQAPYGFEQFRLPLLGNEDVKLESVAPADAPGTLRLGKLEVSVVEGFEARKEGTYQTVELAFKVTPLTTSPIDLSASATVGIVTGTRTGRDVFGRPVEEPVSTNFSVETGPAVYGVEELPAAGRPRGFAGAVGKFGITVTTDQREVNAFDPIDLRVVVEGEGLLERVGLPPWHQDQELTRDFDVSTDVDPGRVEDGRKSFGIVLRARSGQVTQIPALPFP